MAPFGNFHRVILLRRDSDAAARPQSRTERVPAGRDRLPVPHPSRPGLPLLALEGNASIARQGELYFLPARKPKAVELGSPLARKIAEFLRAAGDAAPGRAELLEAVKGISTDPKAVEKVVDGLARAGEIVRVKELLFDGAALRGIQEKLVAFLAKRARSPCRSSRR